MLVYRAPLHTSTTVASYQKGQRCHSVVAIFEVFSVHVLGDTCFACAMYLWILTAVYHKKLGQTPLICETEPSEI